MSDPFDDVSAAKGPRPGAPGWWPAAAMAAMAAAGFVAFAALRSPPPPPPPGVAGDPLLAAGHAAYSDRCVSCHGPCGRGDGPIAKGLSGPPVGDLTDARWKHGDRPDQVRAVIEKGVAGAAMPGWGSTLGPDGVRAVTAYVYVLAGRDVPAELRTP